MKNLFILGDSYSTFEGYMREGYISWYCDTLNRTCTDCENVNDTWWMKFIKRSGYNLLLNDSYSGTTICNTTYNKLDASEISFVGRLDKLINEGYFTLNKVDTFIIFGSTNDCWANSPLGEYKYDDISKDDLKMFRPALAYLLKRAMSVVDKENIYFILNTDLFNGIPESVITICKQLNINLIKLHDISKIDGHPSVKGMDDISSQIFDGINSLN